MTLTDFQVLADAISHSAEAIAIVVGGWWTYSKFIRNREGQSKIDVTADIEWLGTHEGKKLAVVTATVKNSGQVRHKIHDMHFDLRAVETGTALVPTEKAIGQINFPLELHERQPFFPAEWKWSFVEPESTNVYRYSVAIPVEVKFVLVTVKVLLPGDDEFSTSWKVVPVPV